VATFNIATTEVWKDKSGEKQERTDWHRIVAWNALADLCSKYIRKGSKLYIEGSIHTRDYEDKDGVRRYVTEVKAYTIKLLDKKEGTRPPAPDEEYGRPTAPSWPADQELDEDSDLPF
jgi:single-strand DNA-binding protein